MLKWIQQRTQNLIPGTSAERQWKNAFDRVFGKGKRPDTDPQAWEELCRLDRQQFPGRLMPHLVRFLSSQPATLYECNLFASYLRFVPSMDPRLGDVIRNLTDPRTNPDPVSRFWAWEMVFRHRLHMGHFGRIVEPLLNHESQSMTVRLVSRMLLSMPDSPATSGGELSPIQALLRDRLQKLEKEPPRADAITLETRHESFLALWEMRFALNRHLPDKNLPADFHRTFRFYSSGNTLADLLPLIHKAPSEMTRPVEIAVIDGLLRRLHTHPDPRERRFARSLCADLSRQISPEVMMHHLINGLSSGYYPLTPSNARLLHDMLFPKPYSHLAPSPFPPLSPQAQQAAENKLWVLATKDFLKRPDGMGKANRELLVSLHNPTHGRTLSDLIRRGLTLHPSPPGLPAQLAELIPRTGSSIERCELWETMARQLAENPAIGPDLARLTRSLPMRDLVNHINHHSLQLPPQAAALVFNQLLPFVREVPPTHETPSRVALRQLWDQIPPHIQDGFRQRHPDINLLVADPQPVSNRPSPPEFILPDLPQHDPSPFLSLPPTPGQTPHMRLGEIWERFLAIAATDLEKWEKTLFEVQRAVPDEELCRRLGQGHLQRNLGHHVHLWEIVATELANRRRTVGNAQRQEQLEQTIQHLPLPRRIPMDRDAGPRDPLATGRLSSMPTQQRRAPQLRKPGGAEMGRP